MKKVVTRKQLIVAAIIIFLVIIVIAYLSWAARTYNPNKQITYGVTFSKKFAKELKVDWQANYLAMLDELNVKHVRIPTYWDEIEPEENVYNFADIDWQINEANKRDVRVVMVVGRRQPRWPECHDPVWVDDLSSQEAKSKVLKNIELVVNRYKDNPSIEIWQVENEPFLDFFGECKEKITREVLQEEIDLVKSLDDKKILITDSGELSTWYPAIKMGDLFGTTLYRTTYSKIIGYWHYFFLPPSYYRVKADFWGKPQVVSYVAELQAEPWFPNKGPLETPLEIHFKSMTAQKLVDNAIYANKTNFERAYFWGIEWWYWLKTVKDDDSVWEASKQFF